MSQSPYHRRHVLTWVIVQDTILAENVSLDLWKDAPREHHQATTCCAPRLGLDRDGCDLDCKMKATDINAPRILPDIKIRRHQQ